MLRAKQKKAEEEARAKAAQAEAAAAQQAATPMDVVAENGNGLATSGGAETKAGGEQAVRLLGIGGQSVKTGAVKGKRRQPAELRIQKGGYTFYLV
jgi:hypothetical protein